jgi:hypothetical protein
MAHKWPQMLIWPNVAFGSKTDVAASNSDVRCTLNGGHSALQEFRPLSPNSGNSPPADGVFKKPVEVGTTMMYGQCSAIVENFARGIR